METKDAGGATPLFLACEDDKPNIVPLLTSSGAELSTGNRSGETPLYIAALKGHSDIVKSLLMAFAQRQSSWLVRFCSAYVLNHQGEEAQIFCLVPLAILSSDEGKFTLPLPVCQLLHVGLAFGMAAC